MGHNKLPIILLLFYLIGAAQSLKCHKCISIDCPEESPFLCEDARHFTLDRLNLIYYSYGAEQVQYCPGPGDVDRWSNLAAISETCGEEGSGEATCSLGRFRVVTTIIDTKENITSYGTSYGCARRRLLDVAKVAARSNECSIVMGQSAVKNLLKHNLEVEHCFTESEMCRSDFCIASEKSVVKRFREDGEDQSGTRIVLWLTLGGLLILGILIGAVFLMPLFGY